MKKETKNKQLYLEISDDPHTNYRLQVMLNAVRYAARLFDTPPNYLRVSHFVEEAKAVAQRTQTDITVWTKERLQKEGFGGILGVGQASNDGPAFVVLHRKPTPGTSDSIEFWFSITLLQFRIRPRTCNAIEFCGLRMFPGWRYWELHRTLVLDYIAIQDSSSYLQCN